MIFPTHDKDGNPLKRIEFEGAIIFIRADKDEKEILEKFKNRRKYADFSAVPSAPPAGPSIKGFHDY